MRGLLVRPHVIGLKAETDEGEIVGMWLSTENVHLSYPSLDAYHRLARLVAGRRVQTVHGLYVSRSHRHMGLASMLCESADVAMKKQGVELLFAELVVDPQGRCPGLVCSEHWEVEERLGVYPLYSAIHEENEPPCVVCGELPCQCHADLHLYRIMRGS